MTEKHGTFACRDTMQTTDKIIAITNKCKINHNSPEVENYLEQILLTEGDNIEKQAVMAKLIQIDKMTEDAEIVGEDDPVALQIYCIGKTIGNAWSDLADEPDPVKQLNLALYTDLVYDHVKQLHNLLVKRHNFHVIEHKKE
jgi:hypothetical protein